MSYVGPKSAVYNLRTECLHVLKHSLATRHSFLLSDNYSICKFNESRARKHYWKKPMCELESELDLNERVQIKYSNDFLYIYCPYLSITLNNATTVACPQDVFTLPINNSFSIGSMIYNGASIGKKVLSKVVSDLSTEISQKILPPDANYEELYDSTNALITNIKVREGTKVVMDQLSSFSWHTSFMIGILFTLFAIFICVIILRCQKRCSFVKSYRTKKRETEDENFMCVCYRPRNVREIATATDEEATVLQIVADIHPRE